MAEPIIKLKNVTKVFDDGPGKDLLAVQSVDLEIMPGEFFIFLGPSGSGKSTLLRIMSGLEKEYKGTITWGEGISWIDKSFVFQQFALLPWLTVKENIMIGLEARGIHGTKADEKVKEELHKLGLEHFGHVYPRELSGGMKQRVGIARALSTNPKIIFMDEPFSELDSFTAKILRKELLDIWTERKPTIVMVTHIIEDAVELSSRIAVLTDRPGRIEKVVENDLPRPRTLRSSEFYAMEDKLYGLIKP